MVKNTTKRQKLGWVLFISHLCLLAYLIFFPESFSRTDTNRGHQYNLMPFKEISRCFRYCNIIGSPLSLINMIGSVAASLPFGFFLSIINRRNKKWYNTVMLEFGFSPMLEILQLTFHVGSFDVDDIQLNTLGTAPGYTIYRFVQYTCVEIGHRRLIK